MSDHSRPTSSADLGLAVSLWLKSLCMWKCAPAPAQRQAYAHINSESFDSSNFERRTKSRSLLRDSSEYGWTSSTGASSVANWQLSIALLRTRLLSFQCTAVAIQWFPQSPEAYARYFPTTISLQSNFLFDEKRWAQGNIANHDSSILLRRTDTRTRNLTTADFLQRCLPRLSALV